MTVIKETSQIVLPIRTVIGVFIALVAGIWVTALFYFNILQEIKDLKRVEHWTLTDMERYSYRLGDLNRNIVVEGGPFRVPDPIEVRMQRVPITNENNNE